MRQILTFILILYAWIGSGQNHFGLSEYEIDSVSYQLYMKNDRITLENLTKAALHQHIDFYYLRMRIGILEYNAKKYFIAKEHFERALAQVPSDTLSQEYLFYSYIYCGQNQLALNLYNKLSLHMKYKLKKDKPYRFTFHLEAGLYSSNAESQFGIREVMPPPYRFGEADATKNIQYYQAGFNGMIGKSSSIFLSYGFVNMNKNDNFFTATNKGPSQTIISYQYQQQELYTSINQNLKHHWSIHGSYHYIGYSSQIPYAVIDTISKNYKFRSDAISQNNYVINGGVSKQMGYYIKPQLDFAYSHIDQISILQSTGFIHYFPLGNQNFYGSTGLAFSHDSLNNRKVFIQKIGGKVGKKTWVETYAYIGNLKNFNDNNGYIVYNVSDKIKGKYGVTFTFYPIKQIEWSLRYDYIIREASYSTLTGPEQYKTTMYNYKNHAIIGGIIWKF